MNRIYRSLLVLISGLLFAGQTFADISLTNIVKKIQPAVVTVITYDKNKKTLGQGSGFFIDNKGHLITNYHVLKGAYSAEVKTYSGKKYPIKFIIAENEISDLVKVLVDIPEKSFSWLKVSEAIPDVAERILVIGSPLGLEQSVSEGIVSAVRELPKRGKFYQISAPISPGSSGSPVVNMRGEVVGVATFQFVKGQNLNFATSARYILNIKQKEDSRTVAEWTQGIRKKKAGASDELAKRGRSFYLLGEYKKAIPFFKKALEKEPNNYEILFYLGVAYGKLGLDGDAIEAFKQAIQIKPDYEEAHLNLGIAYHKLRLYRDAIGAFKRAIRIDPDDAKAHYNLGSAYHMLRLYRDAIEAFKQAIRIKPDDAKAHYILGLHHFIIGNKGAALDECKILKDLDKGLADKLFNLIYK